MKCNFSKIQLVTPLQWPYCILAKFWKIYKIAHNIFNDAWSVFCRKWCQSATSNLPLKNWLTVFLETLKRWVGVFVLEVGRPIHTSKHWFLCRGSFNYTTIRKRNIFFWMSRQRSPYFVILKEDYCTKRCDKIKRTHKLSYLVSKLNSSHCCKTLMLRVI